APDALFSFSRHARARPVADARGNTDIDGSCVTVMFQGETAGGAAVRIFERELELVLDVAAAPLTRPCARAAATWPLAESGAEERREEVRERIAVAEEVLHLLGRHRVESAGAARAARVDVPLSGEWTRAALLLRLLVHAPV